MKISVSVVTLVLSIGMASAGYASEINVQYSKAWQAAKRGQTEFAFMHYRALLQNNPGDELKKKALFAVGEYYYASQNYRDAFASFSGFLDLNPPTDQRLFALVYLNRIAQHYQNKDLAQKYREQILSLKQNSFVFRDSIEVSYRSPLNQKYKAVYYIDRIDVFLEGEQFETITF